MEWPREWIKPRPQYNELFAVPAAELQPAWRSAPSDHVLLLELCALQYVRKVSKSNTVRVDGRVLDIRRPAGAPVRSYAGKTVIVKHLLSGDYRVHHDGECIAWCEVSGPRRRRGASSELGFIKRERQQQNHRNRRPLAGECDHTDDERHFHCADEG